MVTLQQEIDTVDRLRANLAAHAVAADEMEALLVRERERVIERDWPAVQGIAADKGLLAARLQNLTRELQSRTGDAPGTRLTALGLKAEWDSLLAQVRRLQMANRESRALLDRHHASASAALQMLNRGTATPTYGRHGMAGFGGLRQKLAAA